MKTLERVFGPVIRMLHRRDAAPLLLTATEAAQLDVDCACPDWPFNLAQPAVGAPQQAYRAAVDALICELPQGYRALLGPLTPLGPGVVNASGFARWQQFARPQPLATAFDRALAEQRLLEPLGVEVQPQSQATGTLTAWLHITNACNLDCPYCYVRKSSQWMTEEIGARALRALFSTAQKHGFTTVKLKYAGGEASLHFKLVRRLHELAKQLAADSGVGLQEVLLSNGVHIRETRCRLVCCGGR